MDDKIYCGATGCGHRAAFRAERFEEDSEAQHACGGHLPAAVRAVSEDLPVMVRQLPKRGAR
ncbi:hypothetical protein [Amycolatopsis sp. Poz14]|uniref:hypothetical protein n=1 Tax=Amycolatopsis sp. Poz14 TaxID=1447705 RepID=UPI001EE881A5|nr:hypothetical protein [Amycolatopsis sp. Poz14]MCG3757392.1 hypothetical protein [Amycolatopsis sp. Poz14]